MTLTHGYLRSYEAMMRQPISRKQDDRDEDMLCMHCSAFRPDWKYRYCKHVYCRKVKGVTTFREEAYQA